MPWRRHSSPVPAPASCSCRIPPICSAVNRLVRMMSSLGCCSPREDSHYPWTSFRGARHLTPRKEPVAIATARRLYDTVERSNRPIDNRKVEVDPTLDDLRAYQLDLSSLF